MNSTSLILKSRPVSKLSFQRTEQAAPEKGESGDMAENDFNTDAGNSMMMPRGEKMQMKPPLKFPMINMKCAECEEEEELQMKCEDCKIFSEINNLKSSGAPLDKQTQSFMGSRFGAYFSGVNIHTIQQGAGIQPMIQKDGEEGTAKSTTGSSTPLADLVDGLVRDQLSNSSMRGHLSSLTTCNCMHNMPAIIFEPE